MRRPQPKQPLPVRMCACHMLYLSANKLSDDAPDIVAAALGGCFNLLNSGLTGETVHTVLATIAVVLEVCQCGCWRGVCGVGRGYCCGSGGCGCGASLVACVRVRKWKCSCDASLVACVRVRKWKWKLRDARVQAAPAAAAEADARTPIAALVFNFWKQLSSNVIACVWGAM